MRRWLAVALLALTVTAACGNDDDPAYDDFNGTVDTTVPLGEVNSEGQVQQNGYLHAEVVRFPDGRKYNCVYMSYNASPWCEEAGPS